MKSLFILLTILSINVLSLPEGSFENYTVTVGQLYPTNREQIYTTHINDYTDMPSDYKTMCTNNYIYKFSRINANDTIEYGSVYSKSPSNEKYNMIMMNRSPIDLLIVNNSPAKMIEFYNADSIIAIVDSSKFYYVKSSSNYGMWNYICSTTTKIDIAPKLVKTYAGWLYYIHNTNLYRINSTTYEQPVAILSNIIGYNFDYNGKLWYTTTNALNNCNPDGSNKTLNVKTGSYLTNDCFIVDPVNNTFIYDFKYSDHYSTYPYWDRNDTIRQIANLQSTSVSDSISSFYFNNKQIYLNCYSSVDQKYNVYKIDTDNKKMIRYASTKTYMVINNHRITYGKSDTTYYYNDELVKNHAPVFSTPVTSVDEGNYYKFKIMVKDSENDPYIISVQYLYQEGWDPDYLTRTDRFDNRFTFRNDSLLSINPFTWNSVGSQFRAILKVKDYQDSSTQSFVITVNDLNDTPFFQSEPITTANENSVYEYNIVTKENDYHADTFTYSLETAPANMNIISSAKFNTSELSSSSKITWIPSRIKGIDDLIVPVKIKVTNKAGNSVYQTYDITVKNINESPIITTIPMTSANENLKYEQLFQATDSDTDDLVWTAIMIPSWLTLSNSTLSGTPTVENIDNAYQISLKVTDGYLEDTISYQIMVNNVNDAPIVQTISNDTIKEGTVYTKTIIASDPDNDPLTYSIDQGPASETMQITNNMITWKPTKADTGLNQINIKICDGKTTTCKSWTLVVKKNNAPVFLTKDTTVSIKHYFYFIMKYKAIDLDSTKITYSKISKCKTIFVNDDSLKVTADKDVKDTILIIATDSIDNDTMKIIVDPLIEVSTINSIRIPLKNDASIIKNQIKVALTKNSIVKISMFDLQGKLIYSFNQNMNLGYHDIKISKISSKKYITKIQFDSFQKTLTMTQF
jgi:Bacterial Ig domain